MIDIRASTYPKKCDPYSPEVINVYPEQPVKHHVPRSRCQISDSRPAGRSSAKKGDQFVFNRNRVYHGRTRCAWPIAKDGGAKSRRDQIMKRRLKRISTIKPSCFR